MNIAVRVYVFLLLFLDVLSSFAEFRGAVALSKLRKAVGTAIIFSPLESQV
jgi:hypothetical protein